MLEFVLIFNTLGYITNVTMDRVYNDYSTIVHGMTTLIKVATVNRKIQVITVSSMGFHYRKFQFMTLKYRVITFLP